MYNGKFQGVLQLNSFNQLSISFQGPIALRILAAAGITLFGAGTSFTIWSVYQSSDEDLDPVNVTSTPSDLLKFTTIDSEQAGGSDVTSESGTRWF